MDEPILTRMIEFVAGETRSRAARITPDTRLRTDLGVDGDDAVELLEKFADRFEVNMSAFQFAKYFGSEGFGCSAMFWIFRCAIAGRWLPTFESDITVGDLVEAAIAHAWVS